MAEHPHPALRLADLKKKLAATPASAPMMRELYCRQMANLENEIGAASGIKEIRPLAGGLPRHEGSRSTGSPARGTAERGITLSARASVGGGAVEECVDAFTAHFGVVPVTDEIRRGLNRIHEGIARAKAKLASDGKQGLATRLAAFEATYTKAYLERARLPQAIQLAKRARAQGWRVLLFSETTSEDLFRRPTLSCADGSFEDDETCRKLDREMGGELSRIIPSFPNVYTDLQAAFGSDIADYSGMDNADFTREEAKKNFMDGKTPILYTTYVAGGVGVRLHDTVGDRPRLSIFLGPPYSSAMLEQVIASTWSADAKSAVRIVFIATDSKLDVWLLSRIVGPRLREIRASVLGLRGAKDSPNSGNLAEEGMRERQDVLAYAAGKEVKIDAQTFQVRSKWNVKIDNWSAIRFPHADTAKHKKLRSVVVEQGHKPPSHANDDTTAKASKGIGLYANSCKAEPTDCLTFNQIETGAASAVPNSVESVPDAWVTDPATDSSPALPDEAGRLPELIKNVDLKAMFLLALLLSVIAYLLNHNAPARWIEDFGSWSIRDLLGMLSMFGLVLAAAFVLAALYLGLEDKNRSLRLLDGLARIRFPADGAVPAVRAPVDQTSKIFRAKHRALHYGFLIGTIAAFLALLFLILSKAIAASHSHSQPVF